MCFSIMKCGIAKFRIFALHKSEATIVAQKKKKQGGQQFLSPEQYLKQKARTLEIGKCYISDGDIEEYGKGHILVTRLHKGGRVSFAAYLVDAYCLGVKDSFFKLRMEDYEMENFLSHYDTLRECSYEEAHNWIYGAIAFAEEGGIEPDRSFALTQYMLEEDTDDIPLIEYAFGKDGKHFLVCHSVQEANRYLPILKEHLGDNVDFVIEDGKYDVPDLDDIDEKSSLERLANIKDNPMIKSYGPNTEYTYQHPKYPDTLQLTTPDWFYEELHQPSNEIYLKEELVSRILQLPKELVRENLERIILYHIGQTCEGIPDDYEKEGYTGIVSNCAVLLGEVGNADSSLEVMLELLRQNSDFYEYHFGDAGEDVFTPTLYLLAQNRLERIMDFAKEEGLDTYSKCMAFPAVTQIGLRHPERRDEILEWYREVVRFATEMLPKTQWFDGTLASLLICELIDLQAKDLLPDIRKLFETGLVDIGVCGNFSSVKQDIVDPRCAGRTDKCILDIYGRFADMKRKWER